MSFCYSLVELSDRNKFQEFGTQEEKKEREGEGTVLGVVAAPGSRKGRERH